MPVKQRRKTRDPYVRFFEKVELGSSCWLWRGQRTHGGYAYCWMDGKKRYGHRLVYEWMVGPVPDGLELDHLCRVRHCVNPAHLEAVTRRENMVRGLTFIAAQVQRTHCPQGHPYSPENTRVNRGKRQCRTCDREAQRRRRAGK